MTCTWVDCESVAVAEQIAEDGNVWANLCEAHDAELSLAITEGVRPMMQAWVKAQGGAKEAALKGVV